MAWVLHRTVDRTTPRQLARWAEEAAAFTRDVLGWPGRAIRHRALLASMAGMSDAELSDIGLSRVDLGDASALPCGEDPTALFQARRRERHGHR